ncbi:MAG: hypothetical protein AAB899_02370 [Patescibacteria group bacterium]
MAKITEADLGFLISLRGGLIITFEKPPTVTLDLESEVWSVRTGTIQSRPYSIDGSEGPSINFAQEGPMRVVAVFKRDEAGLNNLLACIGCWHLSERNDFMDDNR